MSKLFRFTTITAALIGLPFVLLSVIVPMLFSPAVTVLSMLFGVMVTVVVLIVLRITPIWPTGPTTSFWWIACALLWGSGVSFVVVLISAGSAGDFAVALRWEESMASFAGAWPEELAKALGVLFILMSFRRFYRPWHGFAVGMVVGLGFDSIENALYGVLGGTQHPSSDALGMLHTWALRLVFGPLMHVGFTGLAGWGIGLALYVAGRSTAWRIRVVAIYFTWALVLHFGWNYSQDSRWAQLIQIGVVAVILYGLWIYVWVRAVRAARADDTYVHSTRPLTSVSTLPAIPHVNQCRGSSYPTGATNRGG